MPSLRPPPTGAGQAPVRVAYTQSGAGDDSCGGPHLVLSVISAQMVVKKAAISSEIGAPPCWPGEEADCAEDDGEHS